jgi:hypothetical protein
VFCGLLYCSYTFVTMLLLMPAHNSVSRGQKCQTWPMAQETLLKILPLIGLMCRYSVWLPDIITGEKVKRKADGRVWICTETC